MFNFLSPWIPRMRKPVAETVVRHAVAAPVIPQTLVARPVTPDLLSKPGKKD